MLKKLFLALVVASLSMVSTQALAQDQEAQEPDPSAQVGVRLLTHFHKKFANSDFGIGGWLIMPDLVRSGATPLFLIGPRYNGEGWWAEVMIGGLTKMDPNPVNAGYSDTDFVQSTRFQFTKKALGGAPLNIFGNLQFIDVGEKDDITDEGRMKTYTFLMVDYVLPNKVALIGVETENYFGLVDAEGEKYADIGFGPQVVLPFKDLNVIMSYQLHSHENHENMMWFRAMYNFGGLKSK